MPVPRRTIKTHRPASPCLDCPDREPLCWGKCPKYQAYHAQCEAVKQARRAAQEERNAFIETRTRRIPKEKLK